jgi:hypothetical protein
MKKDILSVVAVRGGWKSEGEHMKKGRTRHEAGLTAAAGTDMSMFHMGKTGMMRHRS